MYLTWEEECSQFFLVSAKWMLSVYEMWMANTIFIVLYASLKY